MLTYYNEQESKVHDAKKDFFVAKRIKKIDGFT